MTTGVKCITQVWACNADETATPGVAIAGMAGKDAALTGSDVEYDGALGAIILRPCHRDGLPVMNIADWQASGWQVKDGYLYWSQNAGSTLTAVSQHPAAPWIVCKIIRSGQQAEWQLQWGNGRMLTFGTRRPPFFSVNGIIAATLPLNPAEYYNYTNADDICWEIRDFRGDMFITSSAFTRIWYLPGVGGAAAGNLRISADDSKYSASLFAMKFALSGNFYTSGTINAADYAGVLPDDDNVQISAGGSRHSITLTGDGDHTPAVKGWNIFRRPVNAEFIGNWQEVTGNLIGGHLDYSSDTSKSSLIFNDFPDANRMKISQAMELPDGRVRDITRPLMAVTERMKRITNSGTTMRVSAACQQGWLMSKRVDAMPPLCNMPVDEAIALTAEWAGCKKLKIWQNISVDSVERGQWWGVRGGDTPLNEYLNTANDWRGNIPWDIKSDNAWHFIKMIADMHQLRVWFEDDILQIRRANLAYPADVIGYNTAYGADMFTAPTGAAIIAPGDETTVAVNYLGSGDALMRAGDNPADIIVNCPLDITTADTAMNYARYVKSILQKSGGITMTGRTALWDRTPGDAVALSGTGDAIDGQMCRISKVNISLFDPYRTIIEADIPGSSGWFCASAEEIARVLTLPVSLPAELNGIVCDSMQSGSRYFTIGVSAIASSDKIK